MSENQVTPEELESLVAALFCEGIPPAKILAKLEERHNITLTGRTLPWRILAAAATKLRFRYLPNINHQLRDAITAKYRAAGLNRIEIVDSLALGDLAFRTAEILLQLLREHHRQKEEVHIGFAGGGTLLEVARSLGELLRDPEQTRDVPHRLVFHSMVVGWNANEPVQDPNSFSTVMTGSPAGLGRDIRFVGLQAPGIVPLGKYDSLAGFPGIREAIEAVRKIDVIVTSAGRWQCGHSALFQFYENEEETRQLLQQSGCAGDLMWSPLGPDGEIDLSTSPVQMFTLMRIRQLDSFIRTEGKQVLLALGRCRNCGEPKAEILRTILKLAPDRRFITHLVCDSRTAMCVVNE